MRNRRIFARRPSPYDKRDDEYLLRKVRSKRTSRSWNLGKLHLDQFDKPECVGFAACHWLYARPIRNFFAPDMIYKGCKLVDGEPDEEGTYVRAAAKLARLAGYIGSYHWGRNVDAIVTNILEVGPVILGTDWYEGMDEGGVMSATGDILGGHAYLARSVNRKTGLLRIRNSWGRKWGDDGEADLPIDELPTLLKHDGEVLLAREYKPESKWLAA